MTWLILAAALSSQPAVRKESPIVEGNPKSSTRVLIYEDLQCPDCAAVRLMMDERILPKYGSTVAFEHRDFPLAKHSWARKAAFAARFFHELNADQGLEFRHYCLDHIRETTAENFNDRLSAWAASKGIAPLKALAALDDAHYQALVEKDFQDGIARGVSRTPTVFVNGRPFIETFTFEDLEKALGPPATQ